MDISSGISTPDTKRTILEIFLYNFFILIRSFSVCPENEPKEGTKRGEVKNHKVPPSFETPPFKRHTPPFLQGKTKPYLKWYESVWYCPKKEQVLHGGILNGFSFARRAGSWGVPKRILLVRFLCEQKMNR